MRRFFSDVRGNVAIMFALAVVPMFGAMGAAVDYSMANAQRTAMQSAADATVLALAKAMPLSQQQLDTLGQKWFQANLGTTPITNLQLVISPGTGNIDLTATGIYHPEIVNVLGITDFPIGARAQAKWGIGKVEIALALDNTGSMAQQGKMTQLKIAAHSLLDTLQAAVTTPGDAKVAIIPFGFQVRLDTNYRDASWIKYLAGAPLSQPGLSQGQVKNAWQGCITDRDTNHDVLDSNPTSNARKFPGVYYPGEDCGNLATTMFLTTDWNALHAKVTSMQAVGNTYVGIGTAWGWHALSPTMPFSGAAPYNTPNLQKILILLTDGDNTQSRTENEDGGWPSPMEVAAMDARTALACTNAKAAGIKIYSIRVINGNAALLMGCATNPSMYFNVQDASQLNAVFNSIGTSITQLHLAK
jgi:Flp pilus assembly protein TadG